VSFVCKESVLAVWLCFVKAGFSVYVQMSHVMYDIYCILLCSCFVPAM